MFTTAIPRNIVAALLQVIITGVVFFILYRYMYRQLGVDQIGVWSIVLASTSVSRLADLGLSASVVRYVARAAGTEDHELVTATIETTTLSIAALMAIVAVVSYFPLAFILKQAISPSALEVALQILPFALASLWISFPSTVFLGGLDGHQRIDLRAGAVSLSTCSYLALAVALVPQYGLLGIAYAQLAQSFILTILSWLLLRWIMPALPIVPYRWKWFALKPMVGYGLKMQVVSIMSFLFDPVTKLIMGKLGGVGSLGYYEMARKLVIQLRSLIVEANRVVIPVVARADLEDGRPPDTGRFFLDSYRVVFFSSVIVFSSLSMLMPSISLLWTGKVVLELITYADLLIVGWFVNTLIGPAYFINIGSGRLRDNVHGQTIIGVASAAFAYIGGALFQGGGVVVGIVLGLICGSVYLFWSHIRPIGLKWQGTLVPQGLSWMIASALAASVAVNQLAFTLPPSVALVVVPGLVLLWSGVWLAHPFSRQLIQRIRR
jgi:O-antigen/teichoic acid export membrane protein